MFLMFQHRFCWNANKINICLILSTIYIFIPVSSCHRRPSPLLFPGAHNAVKMALVIAGGKLGQRLIVSEDLG